VPADARRCLQMPWLQSKLRTLHRNPEKHHQRDTGGDISSRNTLQDKPRTAYCIIPPSAGGARCPPGRGLLERQALLLKILAIGRNIDLERVGLEGPSANAFHPVIFHLAIFLAAI
jgi:hypothetical protein